MNKFHLYIMVLMAGIMCLLFSCNRQSFQSGWLHQSSPENYTVRFETSKGNFDIAVDRAYSPKASDRFYEMVTHHMYDHTLCYRVVPNFVVQFGITDTALMAPWNKYPLEDEPVHTSNKKGALSYARAGPNTRGNDLFINLKDNLKLDTILYEQVKGFPPFGNVTEGMDVVNALYGGYGDATMEVYDSISADRAKYVAAFPKMDSILEVYVVKK